MRGRIIHVLISVALLVVAVTAGRITAGIEGENKAASDAVSSGFRELGYILADMLWIQLDRYHHIWMYQGKDWVTATDYLPQIWLITKLDPGFSQAYIDGGYHLAINLKEYEMGLELMRLGTINCPDNELLLWENAVIHWETRYRGPRENQEAAWWYLSLVRRRQGLVEEPWNAANAHLILQIEFQRDSMRRNNDAIARHYERRSDLMRQMRFNQLIPSAE